MLAPHAGTLGTILKLLAKALVADSEKQHPMQRACMQVVREMDTIHAEHQSAR